MPDCLAPLGHGGALANRTPVENRPPFCIVCGLSNKKKHRVLRLKECTESERDRMDSGVRFKAAGDAELLAASGGRDYSLSDTTAVVSLPQPPQANDDELPEGVLVADPAMERVYRQARRVACSDVRVLVQGETGSGKEAVMRAIHGWSGRGGRCVIVNCGGIPNTLIEGELFGHERGAFTGATHRRAGVFERADGGTLCLDEIGELPLSAQAALLRVLETGRFRRVGGLDELAVDVRVVAATHRDLRALVEQGRFREDLYYRLDAITLVVPPLRQRPRDIEALARHFLDQTRRGSGHAIRTIAHDALDALLAHDWPGNVRELRNTVEYAATLQEPASDVLRCRDLPASICDGRALGRARIGDGSAGPSASAGNVEQQAGAGGFQPGVSYREHMERYSAALLRQALEHSGGRSGECAELLRLPQRTFQRKLKQHGIKRHER
jgi:DNA-binding NtrC family response regulator